MFSVIIATYNRSLLLKRCLNSLVDQTFKDFEVVLCDDGSTEDILSVCNKYKNKLLINYIRIENSGAPAKPRNTAVSLAKYDWLAFLDSDDWWHSFKLEQVYNIIKNDNYDVIYHKLQEINKDGNKLRIFGNSIKKPQFRNMLIYGNQIPLSGLTLRKRLFFKINGFNEDFKSNEDFELLLRISMETNSFYFLNDVYGYYWVGDNIISKPSEKLVDSISKIYKIHCEKLDSNDQKGALSYLNYTLGVYYLHINNIKKAYYYFEKSKNIFHLSLRVKRLIRMVVIRFKLIRN